MRSSIWGMRVALAALVTVTLVGVVTVTATAQAADSTVSEAPVRARLEQQIRRRFAQVVRNRLGLSDSQMVQLMATNRRFADRRRALAGREAEVRQALRQEMRPGVAGDQHRVSALMDSLFALQRDRLNLAEEEQRDLAAYLTPVQRVQFYALQEALRKRLEQVQRGATPPF